MEITSTHIDNYLSTLEPNRLEDILILTNLLSKVTGRSPKLWGSSIIGYGNLFYKYPSNTSGHMPIIGLSSRKQAITLYLSYDVNQFDILSSLGKYTTGKGCLYIKKLEDIDLNILEKLLHQVYHHVLNLDFVKLID